MNYYWYFGSNISVQSVFRLTLGGRTKKKERKKNIAIIPEKNIKKPTETNDKISKEK